MSRNAAEQGRPWPRLVLFVGIMAAVIGNAQSGETNKQPAAGGSVTYPLLGNLRSQEGTFLCRFRIDDDLTAAPKTRFRWGTGRKPWNRFVLARIQPNETHRILFFWKYRDKSPGRMWTSLNLPGAVPNLTDAQGLSADWQKGEIHTVGYTWDRQGRHTFWLDGVPASSHRSSQTTTGLGSVDPLRGYLQLGSDALGNAVTVVAVHILQKALGMESMSAPPAELFRMTDDTLLLDRFERLEMGIEGDCRTRAVFISGFSGEQGGVVSPGCMPIDTAAGPGLQLYILQWE